MKHTTVFLFAVLLLTVVLQVRSQARPAGEDPPRDLARMLRMEGSWTAAGTMTVNGTSHAVTYKCTFRKTADGAGLTMEEWFDSPELGTLRGMNLIGYDSNTKTTRWFSVDNMGTAHEHVGSWTSDTHFAMAFHGTREGKKYDEDITMDLEGTDRCAVHVTGKVDGKLAEEFRGTFVRDAR